MCVNLQHFVTERVNLHLNSLACVCRAPVSEERSSGSRSCGLASLTHPRPHRCFCRSVRSGRATAASLLALLYCATNWEAEGDSSSERLAYFVQKSLLSTAFSLVPVFLALSCVIRGPWEPLVASSLRSNATFQGSRGPLNHVFSATSASNLYFIGERNETESLYIRSSEDTVRRRRERQRKR